MCLAGAWWYRSRFIIHHKNCASWQMPVMGMDWPPAWALWRKSSIYNSGKVGHATEIKQPGRRNSRFSRVCFCFWCGNIKGGMCLFRIWSPDRCIQTRYMTECLKSHCVCLLKVLLLIYMIPTSTSKANQIHFPLEPWHCIENSMLRNVILVNWPGGLHPGVCYYGNQGWGQRSAGFLPGGSTGTETWSKYINCEWDKLVTRGRV